MDTIITDSAMWSLRTLALMADSAAITGEAVFPAISGAVPTVSSLQYAVPKHSLCVKAYVTVFSIHYLEFSCFDVISEFP